MLELFVEGWVVRRRALIPDHRLVQWVLRGEVVFKLCFEDCLKTKINSKRGFFILPRFWTGRFRRILLRHLARAFPNCTPHLEMEVSCRVYRFPWAQMPLKCPLSEKNRWLLLSLQENLWIKILRRHVRWLFGNEIHYRYKNMNFSAEKRDNGKSFDFYEISSFLFLKMEISDLIISATKEILRAHRLFLGSLIGRKSLKTSR